MAYKVCIQLSPEGARGFVPQLPGCVIRESTSDAVMLAAPRSIAAYCDWLLLHGGEAPEGPFEVELDEVHRAWFVEEAYVADAFFAADAEPLSRAEIGTALDLLTWTRMDLMQSLDGTFAEELNWAVEDG